MKACFYAYATISLATHTGIVLGPDALPTIVTIENLTSAEQSAPPHTPSPHKHDLSHMIYRSLGQFEKYMFPTIDGVPPVTLITR